MVSLSSCCRFCAETKPNYLLKDLRTDEITRNLVIEKLSSFREMFVDFHNKSLPECMCVECFEALESCHEFVGKVKRSQEVLGELADNKNDLEINVELSALSEKEDSDCGLEDVPGAIWSDESEVDDEEARPVERDADGSWAEYSWSCGHCAAALPSMDALREHSKSAHTTCFGFKCADCDARPPPAFSDFVRHVWAHRHRLRNYCPYCDIKMEDHTHMELHLTQNRCDTCGGMKPLGMEWTHDISVQEYQTVDFLPEYDHKPDLQNLLETDTPDLNSLLLSDNRAELQTDCKMSLHSSLQQINSQHQLNIVKILPVPKIITSWESYPISCRFCNKFCHYRRGRRKSRRTFIRHCMQEHKVCFGMSCVDCSETQESYIEFIEHVRKHRPELRGLCPYCDCKVDENDHSHIKQHEENDPLCVLCGKIYLRQKILRQHQKDAHSPLVKPLAKRCFRVAEADLICDICGVQMKKASSLRYHKTLHRARERTITCEECGKTFYTVEGLKSHKEVHDPSAVETCLICNKIIRKSSLKTHVQTHKGKKELQCDFCKRWFRTKNSIRLHLKSHFNFKSFKCSYCGKGFNHKNTLNVHIRQHTGARPYACDSCDKTFVNWSNCNLHMKTIHGTTLAKYKFTPQGRVALTMEPVKEVKMMQNVDVEKWSQQVLAKKKRGKKGKKNENNIDNKL